MSASREKQNRKDKTAAGQIAPKTAREAQQRKEERRSNLLYGLIAAAFAAVVVISLIWNSNILARSATAATVDGRKYNAAQVQFYYRNAYLGFLNQWSYALNYFGLSTSMPLDSQTVSETAAMFLGLEIPEKPNEDAAEIAADADASAETADASDDAETADADASDAGSKPLTWSADMTWKDYFVAQGLDAIASVQNALQLASDENFVFPDSVQKEYEESLASLATQARSAGTNVRRYLQATFGAVMTESVYKAELLRLMKHDAYVNAYQDALTYTDEEIETAYNDDTQAYDYVSYDALSVDGGLELEQDEEGNDIPAADGAAEAAKNAAKNAADALAAGARDGGTLSALSANMDNVSDISSEKENYEDASYTSDEFADWLFDDARKAGDVTVIESGDLFYVVKFNSRFRDETKTVDVRHILIQPEENELEEDDDNYQEEQDRLSAEAKAKAEEVYQQWQDGDKTEESFAALAEEYSGDSGSASNGGLYERVAEGDMVAAFNDWCFDPARQSGDTDIVETDYGYHIMYYVGDNALAHWQAQVFNKLQSDDYQAWSEALQNADIQTNESGMKHVG